MSKEINCAKCELVFSITLKESKICSVSNGKYNLNLHLTFDTYKFLKIIMFRLDLVLDLNFLYTLAEGSK